MVEVLGVEGDLGRGLRNYEWSLVSVDPPVLNSDKINQFLEE